MSEPQNSDPQDLDSELDSLLADLGANSDDFRSEDDVTAAARSAAPDGGVTETVCLPIAAVPPVRVEAASIPVAPLVPASLSGPSLAEAIATMELSAADVAESRESAGTAVGAASLLLCMLGQTRYGVPIDCIVEVTRVPQATRVPHTPAWVRGVTNLRGDVLSVVDLRTLAHLGVEQEGRMLVARLRDGFSVALVVDQVSRIVSVPAGAIAAPTASLQGYLAPFVRGVCEVGGRSVAVLDVEQLLESSEIRLFDGAMDAQLTA